jgi:spore coat polysaccharide biosynthesis predicted glycosyltransferase SpsG
LTSLLDLQNKEKFDVIIIDGKFPWLESDWKALEQSFGRIICIDNVNAVNNNVSDIIFSADYFDKTVFEHKFQAKVHTGSDWIWVHPAVQSAKKIKDKKYGFCIQMGGADPSNLTLLALQDLYERGLQNDSIVVILGPEYMFDKEIHDFIKSNKINAEVVRMDKNFHKIIAASKVLLCAFGLIVVEAESLQVFSILYSHDPEHLDDTLKYIRAHHRNSILRSEWKLQKNFAVTYEPRAHNILHQKIFGLFNDYDGMMEKI